MKFSALLVTILLSASFNISLAAEADSNENEYIAFCNEQAEMAGIEDADEKKQYINACLNNYGITPAE